MIREPKNVDFCTSGRQLSDAEFALISKHIGESKQKYAPDKAKSQSKQAKQAR